MGGILFEILSLHESSEEPQAPPWYIKGFQIDPQKIATAFHLEPNDTRVDILMDEMISDFKRDGYMYIGVGDSGGHGLKAVVIVLDQGGDREELEARDLGPIDSTIERTRPHVLVGPAVWRRC